MVNNLISQSSLPTKKYLQKLHSIYDLDIFSLNSNISSDINPDIQSYCNEVRANYYSPNSFKKSSNSTFNNTSLSLLHNNIRSFCANLENFEDHPLNELNHCFDILGISETKSTNSSALSFNLNLNIPGYALSLFHTVPTPLASGGVGMYINNNLKYSVFERTSNQSFQALWIEIHFEKNPHNLWNYL